MKETWTNTVVTKTLVVLIAEPERIVADLIAEVVMLAGATPLLACDGREALLLIRTHQPVLVITALRMPYIRGDELITTIRREWGASLPVILISGSPVAKRLGAGADRMLPKPFRVADLLAVLDRYLLPHSTDHLKTTLDRPVIDPFEQDDRDAASPEPRHSLPLQSI